MKFFKPWLQDYIVETLPEDSVIVDALNKKAFEVEEVIATDAGTVFDIKVLPNRAHDSLGHHGMAYELCASLSLTFKKDDRVKDREDFFDKEIANQEVVIENEKACFRFMALRMDNITVGESPAWIKERLAAIGQRSINNIVDITNYVQFSLNKPMHAYDASSIDGSLRARFARQGEILTTLDDKSLSLDQDTLVITDDKKVLGLAGIKGGKFSGISEATKSIVLESANFEPTLIRKTAQKYDIRTDASKRFENGIANNLAVEGLHMTANLIKEICPNASKGGVTDVYPKKDSSYFVGISKTELNEILGTDYGDDLIEQTLKRLSFSYEVIVPGAYIRTTYPSLIGAGYKNPSSMREDAPSQFSCSSLISYLYKGIWMPSLSIDKYVFSQKITKEELRFGDLIFANTGEGLIRYESVEFLKGTKVEAGVDHVGMYLGDRKVLHATKVKGMVVEETIEDFEIGRKVIGFGRIHEDLDERRYVVRVPSVRLDLRIKEDLAEEIGRIIGYEKLVPALPRISSKGIVHKRMHYENQIKEILFKEGFSEVMNYTFGDIGEVALLKGLADDKEKLRDGLGQGMIKSFALNLYNAPLLGQKTIKIFEFGNVFKGGKEVRHFAIGYDDGGKKTSYTDHVDMILSEIKRTLGASQFECETVQAKPYIVEINFDALIEGLPEPASYVPPSFANLPSLTYSSVSQYPFITRDIAMWVPTSVIFDSIKELCIKVNNPLLKRVDLFDTFSKEIEGAQKTSYAFRLVFQSHDRTLTDEEINSAMEDYYKQFKEKGYEIR